MKTFYVDVDINKRQLHNLRPVNLASAPALPAAGQVYFDTTLLIMRMYTGTQWVSLSGNKPGDVNYDGMAIYDSSMNGRVTFDLSNLSTDRTVSMEMADTDVIRFTKDVWDSPIDPASADDISLGFTAGSHWLNTVSKRLFIASSTLLG